MKIHTLKVNDVVYDFDLLPAALQKAVTSVEFLDRELHRLKTEVEVLTAARETYVTQLHELVDAHDLSDCVASSAGPAEDDVDFDLSRIAE